MWPCRPAHAVVGTLGDHVCPPSMLCEQWSRSLCWQKYATRPLPEIGMVAGAGPMPTVGWSAVKGQGSVGDHAELSKMSLPPSVVVADITAHGPLSPPARVRPVWLSVARIGSRLKKEYGDDRSAHVTAPLVLSKVTL